MSGPGVSVLVPRDVEDVAHLVAEMLSRHGATGDRDDADTAWDFSGPDIHWYGCDVQRWADVEDEPELAQFDPGWVVTLFAYSNGAETHRFLGEVAADLAAGTRGWVDLGGPLGPQVSSFGPDGPPAFVRAVNARRLQVIRRYVRKLALPGDVRSVDRNCARHDMDHERARRRSHARVARAPRLPPRGLGGNPQGSGVTRAMV